MYWGRSQLVSLHSAAGVHVVAIAQNLHAHMYTRTHVHTYVLD